MIFVKAVEKDGAFDHWSYRQIPAIQGGFMAMDTQTGRVLAMQGGFSYQSSVFNRATQALRQPGSSFKPFVYAAALDSGYSPATIVGDAQRHGLYVRPVDVAASAWDCTLEPTHDAFGFAVRMGLRWVKGIQLGEGAAIAVSMIPFLVAATLFSYFALARRKWQQGESND